MKSIYRYKTHRNHKPIPVGDEVEEFVRSWDCPNRAKQHLAELEKAQGTTPDNERWHYVMRFDLIRAKANRSGTRAGTESNRK